MKAKDRKRLKEIIKAIDIFKNEEKEVAFELVDDTETSTEPDEEDYNTFVYEDKGKILGFHTTGRRSMTEGTYDLYWIVVDPYTQNKGIGKKLLEHAENFVIENNGWWLIAETSSQENYTATRKFYLRNKYTILTQIKDFYSMNDNLIVFGKYLKKI
jgi:aminoglycoside 6'-N-acetyltransferase I